MSRSPVYTRDDEPSVAFLLQHSGRDPRLAKRRVRLDNADMERRFYFDPRRKDARGEVASTDAREETRGAPIAYSTKDADPTAYAETMDTARALLRKMPAGRMRTTLALLLQGKNCHAIASALGVAQGTAGCWVHRVRQRARALLAQG